MFTTVTEVKCQKGKEAEVREMCKSLLTPTRQENGCVDFRLYTDKENSGSLILIAVWESEALWKAHIDSPRQRALAEQSASEEGKQLVEGWHSQHLYEVEG